jgi:N utilization substance protein B
LRESVDIGDVAFRLSQLDSRLGEQIEAAERVATDVVRDVAELDAEIVAIADNWRLERIGIVERNVLRLALHEMKAGDTPTPVVIDEAVRLAHWFAGSKAPGFVNGVLDALARRLGYL